MERLLPTVTLENILMLEPNRLVDLRLNDDDNARKSKVVKLLPNLATLRTDIADPQLA
jgi:hypothetical protein